LALDGTKLEAVASRAAVYTDDRVTRALARLDAMLKEAEATDIAEADEEVSTVPEALATVRQRQARLQQIAAAKLDATASGPYVASEPECAVIKTRAGKRPAYNVQAAVDAEAQVVVAVEVTACAADNHAAPSVLDQVAAQTDARPGQVSMDGGYWSPETVTACADRGIDLYLPPQGGDHAAEGFTYDESTDQYTCPRGEVLTFARATTYRGRRYRIYRCACRDCPQAASCHGTSKRTKDLWQRQWSAAEREHLAKMATPAARAIYRQRARTVEPVFGQMKTLQRFTRFLLRGRAGATIETQLVAIVHNLRKCAAVWRAHRLTAIPAV
jgi:hypothetical protein